MKSWIAILCSLLLLSLPSQVLATGSVITHDCDISWDAVTQDQFGNAITPTGYRVYKGTSSGVYSGSTSLGNVTATKCSTVGITANGQYFVAISAYNAQGESAKSTEIPFVLGIVGIPRVPTNPLVK